MPIGKLKNTLYGAALPLLGKRCQWNAVTGGDEETNRLLTTIFQKRRAVGACVQRFHQGTLTECYTLGYGRLTPDRLPVERNTVFRTASIAKMASALLVFRLQTQGRLDVCEPVEDFLGYRVHNPRFPDAPLTLGMLLNHTSSIIDSPAYYAALQDPIPASELLALADSYSGSLPGLQFRYSNLGAGLVGCMLEARFGESFEALAQKELFGPLGLNATFDLTKAEDRALADSYGVMPFRLRFDASKRIRTAAPINEPDPEKHYLLAAGNLYLTAEALARLALLAWNGGGGFIGPRELISMQTPTTAWPHQEVRMRHGMGLLQLDDRAVCEKPVWGHQGFAYGAVNGVFFDGEGNGFSLLNSGVSEQREGHLALINRDLIRGLLGRRGGRTNDHE